MANERRMAKLEFGEHNRRPLKVKLKDLRHRRIRRRDRAWLRKVTETS